jgi:uncharacterized metal-binding protein YceD (DUF177 family)
MQIEVARIPPEGLDVSGQDEDVLRREGEVGFQSCSPVEYKLHLNYVSGELIAVGSLAGKIRFPCSRCAVPFEKEVTEARFDCVFEAPDGTESVDLTEEMREAILCAFPSHPVCRTDCKGLCAQCGKDLNKGDCDCAPVEDNRWDALGGLNLK